MLRQPGFGDDVAEELVERARAFQPLLLANAVAAERRLSDEVVSKLDQAQLFKVCIPRCCGGLCVSATTMARIGLELVTRLPHRIRTEELIAAWIDHAAAQPPERGIAKT